MLLKTLNQGVHTGILRSTDLIHMDILHLYFVTHATHIFTTYLLFIITYTDTLSAIKLRYDLISPDCFVGIILMRLKLI